MCQKLRKSSEARSKTRKVVDGVSVLAETLCSYSQAVFGTGTKLTVVGKKLIKIGQEIIQTGPTMYEQFTEYE